MRQYEVTLPILEDMGSLEVVVEYRITGSDPLAWESPYEGGWEVDWVAKTATIRIDYPLLPHWGDEGPPIQRGSILWGLIVEPLLERYGDGIDDDILEYDASLGVPEPPAYCKRRGHCLN